MKPAPRGITVTTTEFVDVSHASNKVSIIFHTGFILFFNVSPIVWFSKHYNTVHSRMLSGVSISMKTYVETITSLHHNLRMLGVPINNSTTVICDNESVVRNSSKLESSLNKRKFSLT